MSRTLERSIARREYEKFARRWREEKRLAGVYGKTGYRKPTFSEWNAMHQRDLESMRQSTPADVVEHLGADPWADDAPSAFTPAGEIAPSKSEDRGVVTIDIASGEEERNG
jgi:hypothetical protein